MKIYLAGGMKTPWRNQFSQVCPQHTYLDPTTHHLQRWEEYAPWDISSIEQCDWVVAYMDENNPSGYGMCTEIGYAAARGKKIVFINECEGQPRNKYLMIARYLSDVYYTNLSEALQFINLLPQ